MNISFISGNVYNGCLGLDPKETCDTPEGFVVMASCDPKYYEEHATAYAQSAAMNNMNAHIHMIDPDYKTLRHALELAEYVLKKYGKKLTHSAEYTRMHSKLNPEQTRTYYACNRFIIAPKLFDAVGGGHNPKEEKYESKITGMLITDIDCLFMKEIVPTYDYGLFLRDPLPGTVGWEEEGTRVAAGIAYFNEETHWILQYVGQELEKYVLNNDLKWFVDQVTLHRVYVGANKYIDECPQGYIPGFHKFTNEEMDWEFVEGSLIWTGKGNRKHDNPKYVNAKHELSKWK